MILCSPVFYYFLLSLPAQGGFMQFYSGKCTPIVCKTVFVHFSKGLWLGMQKRSISGLRYWVYGTCLSVCLSVHPCGRIPGRLLWWVPFVFLFSVVEGFINRSIDGSNSFFFLWQLATFHYLLQPLHRAALHSTSLVGLPIF